MIVECFSAPEWLKTVKERYDPLKSLLNSSEEAFTVFYYPNHPNPSKSLLVGRFDRSRQYGVVMCRRKRNIWVEYDRRQPN